MAESDIFEIEIDIVEAVSDAIERILGGEWKHDVSILGMSKRHLDIEIDKKEYVLVFHEVKEGHYWYEYLKKNSDG